MRCDCIVVIEPFQQGHPWISGLDGILEGKPKAGAIIWLNLNCADTLAFAVGRCRICACRSCQVCACQGFKGQHRHWHFIVVDAKTRARGRLQDELDHRERAIVWMKNLLISRMHVSIWKRGPSLSPHPCCAEACRILCPEPHVQHDPSCNSINGVRAF